MTSLALPPCEQTPLAIYKRTSGIDTAPCYTPAVIVTPKSSLGLPEILVGSGAVLVLVLAITVALRRRRKPQETRTHAG